MTSDIVGKNASSLLKNQLRQQLLAKKNMATHTNQNISQTPTLARVSPNQSRLAFLSSLETEKNTYSLPSAIRIEGDINYKSLQNSFNEIIQRQSALRTAITEKNGVFYQEILSIDECPIIHYSVKSIDETIDKIRESSRIPFDLSKPPLIRVALYKINDFLHVLFLNIHHIISDSWSIHVLLNELTELYAFYLKKTPFLPPKITKTFIEYSQQQNEKYHSESYSKQLNFWLQQLKGKADVSGIPADHLRPTQSSYEGEGIEFHINESLTEKIHSFCKDLHITPYVFFLSIFNILISKLSDSLDISVASPIANRQDIEEEKLIGFFVNTLVMRNQINPSLTFNDTLLSTNKNVANSLKNPDVPFDHLVEKINPTRSLSYAPLAQTEFVLQNTPEIHFDLPGLVITQVKLPFYTAKYDLSLILTHHSNAYEGIIEYDSALFENISMLSLSHYYINLIKSALEDPNKKVSTLNLLDKSKYDMLTKKWASGQSQFKNDLTFLSLFEKQTSLSPQNIAVIDNNEALTYEALNQRSDILAQYLLSENVSKGDRIAFYFERSWAYLVSLIACFKVGAIIVPFNPEGNLKRNQAMLKDAKCMGILFNSNCYGLSVRDEIQIFLNAIDWTVKPQLDNHYPIVTLDDIAYMMFTSGSTGKPKGALVLHRGLANHLRSKQHDFKVQPHDVIAQNAIQTFDVSIWQLLVGLLSGAKTVVLSGEAAWEPKQLKSKIKEHNVTLFETVPAHLEILVPNWTQTQSTDPINSISYLISNGEPLSKELAQACFELFPSSHVVNAYGPTECSDDVTHYIMKKEDLPHNPYIPLGRPISNIHIYLLDESLKPVPPNVPGKIYIAGECVGGGYFNDTLKTKGAFIDNPLSPNFSTVMYCTGDLAKYDHNGTLTYIGRLDSQLKIRGIRFDLSEIESSVKSIKEVKNVHVLNVSDTDNHCQLIAFIIPKMNTTQLIDTIKSSCIAELPDFMRPSDYVFLENFPLLSNGKVDIQKLRTQYEHQEKKQEGYQPPETQMEKMLTLIWQEILEIPQISIHDDFFKLGGHSLLALKVINQIEAKLNMSIQLKMLFQHTTIYKLALTLSEEKESSDEH